MPDIRQSLKYALFMKTIGWRVEELSGQKVFLKRVPPLGSFIKIQRIEALERAKLESLIKKERAFQVVIEPLTEKLTSILKEAGFRESRSTYSPSKTLIINIARKGEEIFQSFSSAKRRAIRKAEKLGVTVEESTNIESFANLKNQKLGPLKYFLGYFQTKQIRSLYNTFRPDQALLLASYRHDLNQDRKPVAGLLLLFHQKTAHYWLAASTKEGNQLAAPSLLVWEAIKRAKKEGCTKFDFEGICDDRFKATKSWQGFTKFKKGFGGEEVEYLKPLTKFHFLFNR